ncbi:DUF2652 domain-containing protein [Silvanigrella paludirubra]|uniref:DUF2652 domain-containing protein n=1 Tax=Silvanigrella paludirubra TaxID=2499159 RepID=A0A6N6W0M5_9BACT|nr:DUF2652 domain-containing protein [Silvanigrella paludirubra]KAB8040868.1 DUF2652 domain-containing protein [Silvanigrella paludirubra]
MSANENRSLSNEKEALLFFADISGYTQFVKKHSFSWTHGQFIISELLKILLDQIEEPIKVSKIEGDAIFFYMPIDLTFDQKFVSNKLFLFFEAFNNKKLTLNSVKSCECPCCSNVDSLKLKLIVHSGKILIYQINQFQELSGLDVITLHRLSKNKINKNEYLLITENAFSRISYFKDIIFNSNIEKYDDIGNINTFVHFPNEIKESNQKHEIGFLDKVIFKTRMLLYTFILRIKVLFERKQSEIQR